MTCLRAFFFQGQGSGAATQQQDWKESVRTVALANVAIATLANGSVVNTIILATGNRILLAGQTLPEENGIYDINAVGPATRSADADSSGEVTSSLAVTVGPEDPTNPNSIWTLNTNDPIILGVTLLTFGKLTGDFVKTTIGGNNILALATDPLFNVEVAGDTVPRFTLFGDGKMAWGDGTNPHWFPWFGV